MKRFGLLVREYKFIWLLACMSMLAGGGVLLAATIYRIIIQEGPLTGAEATVIVSVIGAGGMLPWVFKLMFGKDDDMDGNH